MSSGYKVKNFYNEVPDVYKIPQRTYANYNSIRINLPFRMEVDGSSGSMKTNAVLNVINAMNCFDKFYVFTAKPSETLYKFMIDAIIKIAGKKNLTVNTDITKLPEVKDFDEKFNNLVIIDDMINEKTN